MVWGLLLIIAPLAVLGSTWEQTGTGHPRQDDRIYDHVSATAEDVSLEECQAACAGLDQCIGVNYNSRFCWVFSDGCAPSTWESSLKNFQQAGFADCPVGKPDNFLLAEDEELLWFENPEHHTEGTSSKGDALETFEKEVAAVVKNMPAERTLAKNRRLSGHMSGGPSGGPLGADPITVFNGKTIQFWMPLNKYVHMISFEGFALKGMADSRTSLRSMQWFSDFAVEYNDDQILHLGCQDVLKTGLAKLEKVRPPAKLGAGLPVRFLDIDLVNGEKKEKASKTGSYFLSQGVVIADVAYDEKYLAFYLNKETMTIKKATDPDGVMFEFHAAKANKFSQAEMQLEHLHLDMSFGDLGTKTVTGGVLPQIWGIQPRTPEVEKMLTRPY